jgi:hypothetical protein
VKFGPVAFPVARFHPDLALHPSGKSTPSPVPRGATGESGRVKSGEEPDLSATGHTNPTTTSLKIPHPSYLFRCRYHPVGLLPRFCRPSFPPTYIPPSFDNALSACLFFDDGLLLVVRVPASLDHARQVFVHLPRRPWTQTNRRSRCSSSLCEKRWQLPPKTRST